MNTTRFSVQATNVEKDYDPKEIVKRNLPDGAFDITITSIDVQEKQESAMLGEMATLRVVNIEGEYRD